MKILAISRRAVEIFDRLSIESSWFKDFSLPQGATQLKRAVIDTVTYILHISDRDDDDCDLVIFNASGAIDSMFNPEFDRPTVLLDRSIQVAANYWEPAVTSIPVTWRTHVEGALVSIRSHNDPKNWRPRLHFRRVSGDNKDIIALSFTNNTIPFSDLYLMQEEYLFVREHLPDAILTATGAPASQATGVTLTSRLPQGFTQGQSLDAWLTTKLTERQREFVSKDYSGPVRLRGTAGTGKTLSLAVKAIKDAKDISDGDFSMMKGVAVGSTARIGFVVNSKASADLVSAIISSFDDSGILQGLSKEVSIDIKTIYDVAHQLLHFDVDDLKPLSLDGREGRILQVELVESVLREFSSSTIVRLRHAGVSEHLGVIWLEAGAAAIRSLAADLINEFASVIDASGIRKGEERATAYLAGDLQRAKWLMDLPTVHDRAFVLEIHARYRDLLSEMNALSVDQMISDFDAFLDSNRWDRVRDKNGYDALFVDELHLFTSLERQCLHKLLKRKRDSHGVDLRPPIFMAYDVKQSPRDTFTSYLGLPSDLFSISSKLQSSELIKLDKVFRYTPEIAEFLHDLDASFPAINLPDEWEGSSASSGVEAGDKPKIKIVASDVELFNNAFRSAISEVRGLGDRGRRVAVLCVSDDLFESFSVAAGGQYKGKFILIDGREDFPELKHAGKRFIFSMPEYVAGLQFESVILIGIDSVEAPRDSGESRRRRFISGIYLGASRAERKLIVMSSSARGGPDDALNLAVSRGSLEIE